MTGRTAGVVRLDETERAIVAAWRAFVAYRNERTRFDPTLVDAHGEAVDRTEDEVRMEWYTDGSGVLRLEPANPNAPKGIAAQWLTAAAAASAIDAERQSLEVSRIEREASRPRSSRGDPRRGRRRAAAGSTV